MRPNFIDVTAIGNDHRIATSHYRLAELLEAFSEIDTQDLTLDDLIETAERYTRDDRGDDSITLRITLTFA